MSRVNILDWINTGYNKSAFGSWWNKIQHVIHVLHEKYGITVKFGDSHPSLIISIFLQNESYQVSSTISYQDKDKIAIFLRKCLSLHYLNYWKKQTSAGRSASSLSLSGFSTSVVFNSRLSYSEWDFVLLSRSYTLQVGCRFQKVVVCRRCRGYNENLAHAVSHCDTLQAFINARHDTVVDILKTEIQEYCNAELYVNVTCRFVYSTLRVDLQVFFPDCKRIVLIDVKCPFEEKENLDNANRDN